MENDPRDDDLIPDPEVRRLAGGTSIIWTWRRLRDDPTFPRPIQFVSRGRRYWRRGEIEAWIEAHRVCARPEGQA